MKLFLNGILNKGFKWYIKHHLGKLNSYKWYLQMHFHMMQGTCSGNSIFFNNLSSEHILLRKTWAYWAWIDINNNIKCILIWCKPCRVRKLKKCELSFNQEVSYWDNQQYWLTWFMHYNDKVYVYINKLL